MTINKDKRLTKNFKLSEFVYSSYYNAKQQKKVLEALTPRHLHNFQKLADSLQTLRDDLKQPVYIYVCFIPEEFIGATQHTKGKAAQIYVEGISELDLCNTIDRLINKGKMRQGKVSRVHTHVYYDITGRKIRDSE